MKKLFTQTLQFAFLKKPFTVFTTLLFFTFVLSDNLSAQTVTLKQYLYPTGIGNENQEIVQVAVTASSAMTLTQFNLQMSGTTAISDVSNIDVYYMGTSYRYNPAAGTIFGSATPAAGNIAINGSQSLSVGTHYFYVVYDVSSSAVEGNLLDVMVNSVVAGGNTVVPTDVSGSRTILLSQARLARCSDDGSKFYRIPAITTCSDGSLLTAYDKRWNNGEDLGVTASNSIDIVSRRSSDGGKTWSAPVTVAGNHSTYSYTDPCFITDYQTGKIFCLMACGTVRFSTSTAANPIRIYVVESTDNGQTWINGREITNSIYGSGCSDATRRTWMAGVVCPGSGIQMSNGRLATAIQTKYSDGLIHDNIIYSDDHGITWTCFNGDAFSGGGGNEAQIVESATAGKIIMSIRHATNRYFNTSTNFGSTWGSPVAETEITEPGCNGDIARLTTIAGGSDKNRLIQSIPFHATIRTNMSVMLSNDDGTNWPYRKVIYPDMGTTSIGSAYSTLCVLPDNTIGLVYELSDTIPYNAAWAYPYEQIHFVRFSLNWLTGGAESLCQPTGFTAPTSNSPQCTNSSITFTQGVCPTGYTCYWQTSADGTSTANSSSTLIVTQGTPENYTAYVRAYNGTCWTQAQSCVGRFNQAPTGVTAAASDNSICAGDAINLSSSAINTEILISPTVEGSFDPGTTFPLNGWSVVNGASNTWYCGAFAGALSGMNSAYIGTATTYAGTSAVRANHFYRDVAIPAGSSNLVLSFYLKMPTIDNNADFVRVYTTTTSNIPVAGTTPGAGYTQVYNYTTPALASYTLQTITLPDALAGTTVRLVFTYISDNTTGNANPSIDNISLTANTANFSWTSSPTGFTSSLQNPAGVTPAVSTTYTVTASATNGCSETASTTVTVSSVTPTFLQLGPYCVGDIPGTLSTTSLNGITGIWSPSSVNTATAGITTYTFTPTAGQCASVVTMDVTINGAATTPTFAQLGPYCVGATPATLPTTSNNGITGTWNAAISTAGAGSMVYTFTPTAGQCATAATMTVVVNVNVTPTFTQLGSNCVGSTPDALPGTSLNSITGTWSPATISTASAGSTIYTFTPTAGQCATTATMTVVVNSSIDPTFTQLGSYCVGATPDALPATSTNGITGTWSPATISTVSAGSTVYTFAPNAGQCATTATMTVVVNVNVAPTFTQLGSYCVGATPDVLPATSINGITGTWSPATISTVSAGSTNYTFTPTAGQCATTATMTVVVNDNITPTFTQLGSYCVGATPHVLPATSINGITGTWSPATISTASATSTVYTFTPTAGQCATSATMTVVVNANITPTFTQLGPYCVGATPGTLPTTSLNGISGTWNATISTAGAGSTVYTFTPTAGLCATTATMSVVVNANIVPTFTQLGPYCVDATPATLPTTSNNGITGTWDAAISTAGATSTVYTFAPTAGQCATAATMTVVVNANITPTFTQLGPYCIGATPGTLPTTSLNGISGTWNATISTASAGSTVYTFTPNAGQCATTATMTVVVNSSNDPTFTQLGSYCVGATPSALPTTSLNGITGTWSPATISTAGAGSPVYTFTPTAGQCATTATMTVVVNVNVAPTFTQLGSYCVGATPDVLPATSINGITGTWSPATISTASAGSTIYTFAPNAGQCATTATMTVVTSPSYAFSENYSICNGNSYTWHGTTYTAGGTFTKSYTTVNGCDSIYTLNLTLNPTYAFNENHSICNGNSYTWHGTTYTAGGIYTAAYTTVNGCDSIYTLNLTVNPTYAFSENHSICNGDSYIWHGTTYTAGGIYTAAYTTVNGCDSIYTLNLTVNPTYAFTEDHAICNGDSYTWHGTTYTAGGIYTAAYTTVNGCDSIYTLNLTVNPTYALNENHSICNGNSYTWHGTTYTTAGIYTAAYMTVIGCDSIYTLNLTEVTSYSFVEDHSICTGDSYIWQGSTYNTTGTYTAMYVSSTGCDSIYTLNLTVNPTYVFNEDHAICNGNSYTWHGTTYTTAGVYTAVYTTVNGCDSIYTLNLIVNPTYAFNENHSICNGGSYIWHGTTYTASGTYTSAFTTVNGCDSIYTLNLTVNPTYAFNEDHAICNGDSYTWHGTTYTAGGTFTKSYTTVNGCDSIYTLNLTVNPTYAFNENHAICNGNSYTWHGTTYTAGGIYTAAYTTVNGCDSIYTLNLTVNPTYAFNENHSVCNGDSYTWHGTTYTAGGTYTAAYTTVNGCDSIYTLNLTVNPTYAFNENHSVCNGDSYTWHGTTYTAGGTYTAAYTTVNGCDSIYTLNLTVNPTYAFNENHSICNGDSYTWHGTTYTTAGVYTAVYTTVNGCDSIYTLNLIVNPTYAFNENHSICNGDSYTWHGTTYTAGDIYTAAYTTVNGCDSIYTLNLTVNPTYAFNENHSICNGDSYTWHGTTYTAGGTYTATYTTINGCDSVYTMNLIVNPTYAFNENHSICNGDSYTWHGTTYSAGGTYTAAYTTVNGCDSIYTLNLTEVTSYSFVEDHSICTGDSYIWQGSTYNTTGTYTAMYVSSTGCDSIYTLNLTVNPTYAFNEDHAICNGDSYTWHGTTYTAGGIYTAAYTTVNGCDSIYTLNLTVNPTYAFNDNHSICNGDSYTWHGTTYTAGGIYTASYTTVNGCDSIYTLNLTVNPTYAINDNHSICNGDSYTWHGTTYTAGGTYTAAYTTVNGCDSIYTLNLIVNPTYAFNENHSICEGDVYNWHGNIYSTEGIYYDSLQTQTGCDSTFTLNLIVNPLPDIFLGNDTTICADASIVLDGGNTGATYLWSEGGANGQTLVVDSTNHGLNTFDVSVTVNNGCETSDTISITIEVCDAIDENGDNVFSVFPNPSDGIVNIISSNQFSDAQIELTDVNGKLIYCRRMSDLNGITGNKQFDLGMYPAGVYFMHINDGAHVEVIKVVRQ